MTYKPNLYLLASAGLVLGAAACGGQQAGERNLPPVIDSFEADNDALSASETTTLTVKATDPDGDAGALSYEWSVSDDAWSISPADEPGTAELTAADAYTTSVEAQVRVLDAGGAATTETIQLETVTNELPIIEKVQATPNPVDPAGQTTLKATAKDLHGDELSYTWSAPDGWTLSANEGAEVTLTAPDEDGARADIEVSVADGYGGETSSSLRVDTTDNNPPSISSVTASPPQIQPGATTTVTVSATDSDGDELSYAWSTPMDWTVNGQGNEVEVTGPDAWGASGTIEVTVTDPRGAEASGQIVVTTAQNNGPSISSLTANPQSVMKGDKIALSVDAADPDGQMLSYKWDVSGQDWTIAGNGTMADLAAPDTPGESTTVKVTVTDPEGKSATASTVVSTRPNQAPNVTSLSANPPTVAPKGSSTLSVTAKDPDGDSLSYNWRAPSGWTINGSGNEVTVDAPDAYGKSAVITVDITDGFQGSASSTVVVSTERNAAPVLSSVTANPSTVAPQGKINVEALVTDPNGDSLTYSWTVPSKWSKSGSGAKIELTAPGSYGESGLVKLTVEDGHGGKATGSALVQTDRNQSPRVNSVTANPTTVDPKGQSTLTASATDPNGDSITYSWKAPKNWTVNGSGAQVTVTAPDAYDAAGTFEVTADDGNGGKTTSAVTVQTKSNLPPRIASLSIADNPVLQNGTTEATVTATDPQGDKLNYKWTVTNIKEWSVKGNGETADVTAPDKAGSKTTLKVVVDDGYGLTDQRTLQLSSSSCPAGADNCDGNIANGCEAVTSFDDKNCGACGNACKAGAYCGGSTCNPAPSKNDVLTASYTRDAWLRNNPYYRKHDGGWAYSPAQDAMYSIYQYSNSGRNLFRVEHKKQKSSRLIVAQREHVGSHPVIDHKNGWVYLTPGAYDNDLERVKLDGTKHQQLQDAPHRATYVKGAFKDGKLWMVLNDNGLYHYDPKTDKWTRMRSYPRRAMVTAHGSDAVPKIYILTEDRRFFEYNVKTGANKELPRFIESMGYGANSEIDFIPSSKGHNFGFIWAACGYCGPPAIYSIADDKWYRPANRRRIDDGVGHTAYDSKANRFYFADDNDIFYYQY